MSEVKLATARSSALRQHVINLRNGGFIRFYLSGDVEQNAALLVPPIGMAVGVFEALSRLLIDRGMPLVSWELGDIGGDASSFYDHVSSFDEICESITQSLNVFGLGACSAVSLCNGASILAHIQSHADLHIRKSAIVGPYFHLRDLEHNSTYEKTLMPLLAKAGDGSAASAKMIHRILNLGAPATATRKDEIVKAHLVSADAILAYARALNDYRRRDEIMTMRELRGEVALFYCLDDEAVSEEYFSALTEHLVGASRYIYQTGGHYAVFDDDQLITDVISFLTREEAQHV